MASPLLRRNLITTIPDNYTTTGDGFSRGRGQSETSLVLRKKLGRSKTPMKEPGEGKISCGRVQGGGKVVSRGRERQGSEIENKIKLTPTKKQNILGHFL